MKVILVSEYQFNFASDKLKRDLTKGLEMREAKHPSVKDTSIKNAVDYAVDAAFSYLLHSEVK